MGVSTSRVFLSALVGGCLASSAAATSVVALSEADLVAKADVIVRALVLEVETIARSQVIPVYRRVALAVEETLKGDLSEGLLHVSLPGGERAGIGVAVPGTPTFYPGEEVVAFLTETPEGEYIVVGFSQGKYRITPDPETGIPFAERTVAETHLVPVAVPGQTSAQALRAAAPNREAWAALRRRILDKVAEGSADSR